MSRLLIIPLALLLLMIGAIAWSGGGVEKRADFAFVNTRDIITLDINQMSYLQDIRIAYAIWEGLYSNHPQTLEPTPAVAQSVDVSDDKRVYTFHLRPQAKWSNGDPVTANDFVFSWRRQLENPAEYSYLLYYIKNAEPYLKQYSQWKSDKLEHKGKSEAARPSWDHVGVKAIDEHTLRMELENPVAFLLDLVAFPTFLPLNERSMEKFKSVDQATGHVTYDSKFTRPPHVVGNGPFNLVDWQFKRHLRLRKNDKYWDREQVVSNSIEMLVVEDPLGQILLYESGEVDWVSLVPTEIAAEMKQVGRKDLRNFAGFGSVYLNVNVQSRAQGRQNPLADLRVRQALALAIEKNQIVRNITRMGERAATTYIPPGIFEGYQTTPGLGYDPGQARKLLAQAGYGKNRQMTGVTLLFSSASPVWREMAQNLQKQWQDTLELRINLESLETKIYRQRINAKDYTISIGNWIGDYADASTFTDKYRSTSENNDSAWVNAEYDSLLDHAAREPDAEKRLRLLEQAERILNHELPIIPLYHLTNQYLFRDNVIGINTQPRNMTMLKGVGVVGE